MYYIWHEGMMCLYDLILFRETKKASSDTQAPVSSVFLEVFPVSSIHSPDKSWSVHVISEDGRPTLC